MLYDRFDYISFIISSFLIILLVLDAMGFVLENSINLIDLLSLFVTIFIALYFGNYLNKKQNISSRNREIVLDFINSIEDEIIKYRIISTEDKFNLVSINSKNKQIKILIKKIPILFNKVVVPNKNLEIEIIEKSLKEVHKLLTYYTDGDILDGVYKIEDNNVTIDSNTRSTVEHLFFDIQFNIICLKISMSGL